MNIIERKRELKKNITKISEIDEGILKMSRKLVELNRDLEESINVVNRARKIAIMEEEEIRLIENEKLNIYTRELSLPLYPTR